MLRHSFRRSPRPQGFKVKHALQIFLLVSVSVWLLYQVRHSRDKSAYEEAARVAKETLKLGRKDLLPSMADAILPEVMIHKVVDQQHKIVNQPKPQGTETRTTIVDGTGEEITKNEEKKEEHEHLIESGSSEEKAVHEGNDEAKKVEEEKDESEGKTDEAVAGTQESCGDLDIPEMGENKAHDEVPRWSNTNSTEAYIHQEDRDMNMNIKDNETNKTLSSSSDIVESNNSTDSASDEGNSTVTETATCGEDSSAIDEIGSLANATLFSEATLLRTEDVKSNSTEEARRDDCGDLIPLDTSNNDTVRDSSVSEERDDCGDVIPLNTSNNDTVRDSSVSEERDDCGDVIPLNTRNNDTVRDSSVSEERDECGDVKVKEEGDYSSVGSSERNTGVDDVQKLKEEVDYSSVSRKEDETSGESKSIETSGGEKGFREDTEGSSEKKGEKGFREDTEGSSENGSSVSREGKDARTELEALPGSLTGGGKKEGVAAE